MALDADQILILELALNGAKERFDDLTEWEQGFMVSTDERYELYKESTRFSDKQWAVVLRVYEKVME